MEDHCFSKHFKRFVNFYCIFDEDPGDKEVEFSSAAVFVLCLLSIIFDLYLFKQA